MIKSNPQDIAGCLSYLEKALKLDPRLKERVKTEMDFESIKKTVMISINYSYKPKVIILIYQLGHPRYLI